LLLGDLLLGNGDLLLGNGVAGLEACVVAMHGGVEWLGLTFLWSWLDFNFFINREKSRRSFSFLFSLVKELLHLIKFN
jgi:hypothetical protein